MSRLGIFSFYDPEGVVDSYIEHLLTELTSVVDKLIITVNGRIDETGLVIFRQYTDTIVIRENKGFDSGAYADVIVNMLGEDLKEWDEVVLSNDTFWGPFIPLRSVFEKMDLKNVDFWGFNYNVQRICTYIEDYFVVFRKNIICSGDLLEFFKTNINPFEENRKYLFGPNEAGMTRYFSKREYRWGTYTYTHSCDPYRDPYDCLREYNLPLLKKKVFSKKFFNAQEIDRVLQYLKNTSDYDISHILRNAKRLYGFEWLPGCYGSLSQTVSKDEISSRPMWRYSADDLIVLVNNRKFYIYGAGHIACTVFYLGLREVDTFQGFVVSNDHEVKNGMLFGCPVFHYCEIPADALIVLGVDKKNTEEIKSTIGKNHEIIELWE